MDLNEFKDACLRTAKDKNTLSEDSGVLFNWILGLCGESGELADAIKKYKYHGHELNFGDIQKELGDVIYYWTMLCHYFNLDPNVILEMNVEKLIKRYPDGFSSFSSINRVE